MTDPTGPCFLSYKRERASEAALIVGALRDRGVPTWQDIADLPSAPTETALEQVLHDPTTSGAVLLVTPEVASSDIIRKVEAPTIFSRVRAKDGFFAVPVAAGGAGYGDVGGLLGPMIGLTEMSGFNILKAPSDPIDAGFAARAAASVLRERLGAIAATTGDAPLELQLSTRTVLPKAPGFALRIDLTHRFAGRHALANAWATTILPAFGQIAAELARSVPGRPVEVSGFASLPAAVAFGAALPVTGPVRAAWSQEQAKFGVASERWALDVPGTPCGFQAERQPIDPSGTDIALLVSATNDVVHDFSLVRSSLPLRAVVHVAPTPPRPARIQLGAGEGRDLACLAVDALREAVAHYAARGVVHLFLAVPAGVAFMIGQQLNTLGRVQTYEHDPAATAPYVSAALLTPSH